MNIKITGANLIGSVKAIPSKSHAHRLLICAALADQATEIICEESSADIDATCDCLHALCAQVQKTASGFCVTPRHISKGTILHCRESGSTFRFLLPVACALGAESCFSLKGRLPMRPMEPLYTALEARGIMLSGKNTPLVSCSGKLSGGRYTIPGNVSSQFISGLLFALALVAEDSEIEIIGKPESRGYIDITLSAIRMFGIEVPFTGNSIRIRGSQRYLSPKKVSVEGDWSNAAFWLCAGSVKGSGITVTNLKPDSLQGDKAICEILRRFGADVQLRADSVAVRGGNLRGITIDVKDIPDLVPALAVVASVALGKTKIINAGRLKLKESNRLETVAVTLKALGAEVSEMPDGLLISGQNKLTGGSIKSYGDHRIAMMAAIASAACDSPVIIEDAHSVNKSYPRFFDDFKALGGLIEKERI